MTNMNYFEKKELNTLKGEIIARDAAIEAAKQKIKKWEQFKSLLDNDLYIIKQNGE